MLCHCTEGCVQESAERERDNLSILSQEKVSETPQHYARVLSYLGRQVSLHYTFQFLRYTKFRYSTPSGF